MAVRRDLFGNIDRQEFENHLKAPIRNEGYIEIILFTPDDNVQVSSVTSNDILNISNIDTLTDITKYTSSTVATLEENLWLLNGRFIIYQGNKVDGYISSSISDENGDFQTNPSTTVTMTRKTNVETCSVILNSAVPSGYPKDLTANIYDTNGVLIKTITKDIEWEEDTGEIDEDEQPIYRKVLLDTLPSVNIDVNEKEVGSIVIEYGSTRVPHRRIRVSNIIFGKTYVFNQNQILKAEYTDKASYVCDTLPSRTFSFDINNYDSEYNIDNPNNEYIKANHQSRIRFRNGYNVYGYKYDDDGYVIMENDIPVTEYMQRCAEIEWDNWKELRLMDVSTNADESVTFTAGSLLDIMEDTYTKEIYYGNIRRARDAAEEVLNFEGLPLNSIEWDTDGIKKPTYDSEQRLLPYEQWTETSYALYNIATCLPEVQCKQIIQLLAFSVGATILIMDNGHIKFAKLNLEDSTSFPNTYNWTYKDFEEIPVATQLESVNKLTDISIPKYTAELDYSGTEIVQDTGNYRCSVIATVTCEAVSTEITYSECLPIACRIKSDDPFKGTIAYTELYCRRGIVELGGFTTGDKVRIEVIGYPIKIKQTQERYVTSDSLVLDTQIMKDDVSSYSETGIVRQKEMIKRKYLFWYQKKFKYNITTRGEPLVNAGDYGVIQTQFTEQLPVYILQNHWVFDGAWSGDMEVIALD